MNKMTFSYHAAAFTIAALPEQTLPEFAVIGRSNVGKSSLINTLAAGKKIARTSKSPGKTRALHFYQVNADYFLVDLPGYGFARVPLEERNRWDTLATAYLASRSSLIEVLLLVDARHSLTKLDLQMISWLCSKSVRFTLIATKMDKLGPSKQAQAVSSLRKKVVLFKVDPDIIPFSAMTGMGKRELLAMLYHKSHKSHGKLDPESGSCPD